MKGQLLAVIRPDRLLEIRQRFQLFTDVIKHAPTCDRVRPYQSKRNKWRVTGTLGSSLARHDIYLPKPVVESVM